MKKWQWISALGVAAVSVATAVYAAEIGNLSGQSCGGQTGTWHFINNQVPSGSGTGTLTATWSSGNSCSTSASAINKSTQHFYCTASGTLLSASTNLGGKLVLSDFTCSSTCTDPKGCEPPPCDPKTDPTCK
jgi:hypothetical protein